MPVVRIDFDNQKITEGEVKALVEALQKIVLEATKTDDVPVYANHSEVSVQIHPIEIFVQMSAYKIQDLDALVADIKSRLSAWKAESGFKHLINFSFIPMEWKIEIGI